MLEGIQQLYRFHDNWVRYRWTNAGMQRERSLWTARASDYATADRPDALLALRIEDLTSREATQWVALQSQTGSQPPPAMNEPPGQHEPAAHQGDADQDPSGQVAADQSVPDNVPDQGAAQANPSPAAETDPTSAASPTPSPPAGEEPGSGTPPSTGQRT